MAENNQSVWGFEFGNEVNNNGPTTPCNQTPAQQASGQLQFAAMARRKFPNVKMIGPDSGGRDPQQWLAGYLLLVARAGIHAITHHVYAGISRSNFNSAARLNASLPEIEWYSNLVFTLAPQSQKWAGENGPTGGGADGTCGENSACGTFATTLWYADDLALRAKHGFVQYQRQDLIGGHYGLLNTQSTEQALTADQPVVIRPDYWINFLYKRLIGTNVLNATSSSSMLRAYAFSGDPPSQYAEEDCRGNAVQLLLINLSNESVAVDTGSIGQGEGTHDTAGCAAWNLSPSPEGPFSTKAMLNGAMLPSSVDSSVPDYLEGIQQAKQLCGLTIDILPVSTTFVCIKEAY